MVLHYLFNKARRHSHRCSLNIRRLLHSKVELPARILKTGSRGWLQGLTSRDHRQGEICGLKCSRMLGKLGKITMILLCLILKCKHWIMSSYRWPLGQGRCTGRWDSTNAEQSPDHPTHRKAEEPDLHFRFSHRRGSSPNKTSRHAPSKKIFVWPGPFV